MSIFEQNIQIPHLLWANYASVGMNEQDLVIVLKLIAHQVHSNEMPSFEELSEGTTMHHDEVSNIILKLIQHQLLKINIIKNSTHIIETFTLEPLEQALLEVNNHNETQQKGTNATHFSMLFEKFESAFGRPLTPIELETISYWFDQEKYGVDLIVAALNEALSHQKLSVKYIDKILLNWKKQNVKTVEASKAVSEQFKVTKKVTKQVPAMPFFDWINEEHPYDKQ